MRLASFSVSADENFAVILWVYGNDVYGDISSRKNWMDVEYISCIERLLKILGFVLKVDIFNVLFIVLIRGIFTKEGF